MFENSTISVKDITDATIEFTKDKYNEDAMLSPKNVTYSNDLLYKMVLESDAVYFDAGDKKNANDEYMSYASEVALVDNDLVYYDYVKTSSGWTKQQGRQYSSNYTTLANPFEQVEEKKDQLLRPMLIYAPFDEFRDRLQAAGVFEAETWQRKITSWYDANSGEYKISGFADWESTRRNYMYGSSFFERELNNLNFVLNADTAFLYLGKDENNNWEQDYYYNAAICNMSFDIENEQFTKFAFDVYFLKQPDNYYEDDAEIVWDYYAGMHFEITDIGSSVINVDSSIQPSRANYNGKKVADEVLVKANKFYEGGNYTVRYVADFYTRSHSYNGEPEFECVMKVTPTAVSYYCKSYDANLGATTEEYFIQTIEDETHIATYTYDVSTGSWWKSVTRVAENTTPEEAIGSYAEFYWYTWDEIRGYNSQLEVTKLSQDAPIVRYSDTLKAYVRDSEYNVTDGEDDTNTFDNFYVSDIIYNFNETGLTYYMQRACVKYYPDKLNQLGLYASGQLTKVINEIGSTTVTVPTEFMVG